MIEDMSAQRTIAWFSAGAASAIATKLSNPDVIAYCDTGSEDMDNARFRKDCEKLLFGSPVTILQSQKFNSTWAVWEKRRYISGIKGAPCTFELKVAPRLLFERPHDIHIFGYTADGSDVTRWKSLQEHYPNLTVRAPLIERGITKAACLAMIERAGIKPPRVYALGFPNANCIPCCKATSPAYWALVRKHFPEQFERFSKLSRELGVRAARVNNERVFVDEVPLDQPTTDPITPDCDFLCALAEQEFAA